MLRNRNQCARVRNNLETLIKPAYRDDFCTRFNSIMPYLCYILDYDIPTAVFDIYLSGGRAAYLIGRFNSFGDIDIFVSPKYGDRKQRQESVKHLVTRLHTHQDIIADYFTSSKDPSNYFFVKEELLQFTNDRVPQKIQIIIKQDIPKFDLLECAVFIPLFPLPLAPYIYLQECACYERLKYCPKVCWPFRDLKTRKQIRKQRSQMGKCDTIRANDSASFVVAYKHASNLISLNMRIESASFIFSRRSSKISASRVEKYVERKKAVVQNEHGFSFLLPYCVTCHRRDAYARTVIDTWKEKSINERSRRVREFTMRYHPDGDTSIIARPSTM